MEDNTFFTPIQGRIIFALFLLVLVVKLAAAAAFATIAVLFPERTIEMGVMVLLFGASFLWMAANIKRFAKLLLA